MEKKKNISRLGRLTIPNNLSFLPMARNFIVENATIIGFEAQEIKEVELAIDEAVSNVIEHAFLPDEEAEFTIICERTPLGLKTVIRDKGQPFDPTILPSYDPDNLETEISDSGLGLYLMQQFMDKVSFFNLGRDGKEIHLIKYLQHKKIEKPLEVDSRDIRDSKNKQTIAPRSVTFEVRKAQKSEMIEISKCAYDAYGYSYGHEHIYYPDRMWTLIKSELIISAVAVTNDDSKEIIAHNALMFDDPNDRIAEMGMAFTKHQQQSCSRKLASFLINEAAQKGVVGILIHCTTAHVYSQVLALRGGASECCVLLGIDPEIQNWKHFESQGQRVSNIITYMRVSPKLNSEFPVIEKELYVPNHHRAIIAKIYSNLDEKPIFIDEPKTGIKLPETLSVIKVHAGKSYQQAAIIEIESFGYDVVQQTSQELKRLCVDKLKVIYLYYNLEDPLTASMTTKFEAMGFFFAGIVPGADKGDKLELQYLNNVLIDYTKIQLHSDFSKELLDYIQAHDPLKTSLEN